MCTYRRQARPVLLRPDRHYTRVARVTACWYTCCRLNPLFCRGFTGSLRPFTLCAFIAAVSTFNGILASPTPRRMAACGPVFFFQAEDGIRDTSVTGVQTCALPI